MSCSDVGCGLIVLREETAGENTGIKQTCQRILEILITADLKNILSLTEDQNVRQNKHPVRLLPVLEAAHPITGPVGVGRPRHFYGQVKGREELLKTSSTGGGRFGVTEVLHI